MQTEIRPKSVSVVYYCCWWREIQTVIWHQFTTKAASWQSKCVWEEAEPLFEDNFLFRNKTVLHIFKTPFKTHLFLFLFCFFPLTHRLAIQINKNHSNLKKTFFFPSLRIKKPFPMYVLKEEGLVYSVVQERQRQCQGGLTGSNCFPGDFFGKWKWLGSSLFH